MGSALLRNVFFREYPRRHLHCWEISRAKGQGKYSAADEAPVENGSGHKCIFCGCSHCRSAVSGRCLRLNIPFYLPMVCLALSMFPALICTIFSGYYNASGHSIWADGIIFLRVFLLPAVSLYLLLQAGITPWLFLRQGKRRRFWSGGSHSELRPADASFILTRTGEHAFFLSEGPK